MECSTCIYALETVTGGYSCSLSGNEMDLCPYLKNGGRPRECPKFKRDVEDAG